MFRATRRLAVGRVSKDRLTRLACCFSSSSSSSSSSISSSSDEEATSRLRADLQRRLSKTPGVAKMLAGKTAQELAVIASRLDYLATGERLKKAVLGRDALLNVEARRRAVALVGEPQRRALRDDGYCVIDGAVSERLGAEFENVDSFAEPARQKAFRDDRLRFLSEAGCAGELRSAILLLKHLVHCFPDEKNLGVTPEVMLASYGPGGRYARHSDNSRDEATNERRNERRYTAIVYATDPDWAEKDGGSIILLQLHFKTGELRLWPRSSEVVLGGAEEEEEGEYVDIQPRAGRLVVFDSTLLHEVRPNTGQSPRRALTCWLNE